MVIESKEEFFTLNIFLPQVQKLSEMLNITVDHNSIDELDLLNVEIGVRHNKDDTIPSIIYRQSDCNFLKSAAYCWVSFFFFLFFPNLLALYTLDTFWIF